MPGRCPPVPQARPASAGTDVCAARISSRCQRDKPYRYRFIPRRPAAGEANSWVVDWIHRLEGCHVLDPRNGQVRRADLPPYEPIFRHAGPPHASGANGVGYAAGPAAGGAGGGGAAGEEAAEQSEYVLRRAQYEALGKWRTAVTCCLSGCVGMPASEECLHRRVGSGVHVCSSCA